jgi:hypothetical protein
MGFHQSEPGFRRVRMFPTHFKPKDGLGEPAEPERNSNVDFKGKSRSNETHASTTDPQARLL